MKLLCICTWRSPLKTLEENPYLPLNDRNKNPTVYRESQAAYATNNNSAACGCLEKSDKIIIAQMWLKTFWGGGGGCLLGLRVAYARNRPLHKIIVAKRVVFCDVRISVPPDTVNTHSVFAST